MSRALITAMFLVEVPGEVDTGRSPAWDQIADVSCEEIVGQRHVLDVNGTRIPTAIIGVQPVAADPLAKDDTVGL